jgi:hypothetical protein
MNYSRNPAAMNQRAAISFLTGVGIAAVILLCCQPIMSGVSTWVETTIKNFPLLGQFAGLLRSIPFVGKGLAVLFVGAIKYAGALSALAVYALLNLCQFGIIGGPRERAIAYALEGAISVLNITIYGTSFDDLVGDFPDWDPELIDWQGMWRLAFSLFGPEIAFGFLTSTKDTYRQTQNQYNNNRR